MKPTSMYKTYKKHLYLFQRRKHGHWVEKHVCLGNLLKLLKSPALSSTVDRCLIIGRQKDGIYFVRVLQLYGIHT